MKTTLVIFGAEDHESIEARKWARRAGAATATATYQGQPVHAGTAYKADGYRIDTGDHEMIQTAIIFECNPNCAGSILIHSICDHHRPGDFGYDMKPENFWPASSLGQLWAVLGLPGPYMNNPAHEIARMTAAGDHCPKDAYQGLCPGIGVNEFQEFRLCQKAVNGKEYSKIKWEINEAVKILEQKDLNAALYGVIDLREYGQIPELPEAAMITGKAYLSQIQERDREGRPTGNDKIVLGGDTTPEQVEQFLAWAKELPNRVGEPYGVPSRGFGGVVIKGGEHL